MPEEKQSGGEAAFPAWLNEKYFENALQLHRHDKGLKVEKCTIKPASALGEHFGSIIFRCTVQYRCGKGNSNSISVIVKSLPEVEGHQKTMLDNSPLFKTESAIYTKIIPQVEKRLQDVGINFKSGSECIYYSLDPRQEIVFTDVTVDDFVMKRELSTFEEVKPLVEKLAQWHAATFVMLKEDPSIAETYTQGFMGANIDMQFMVDQFDAIANAVGEWPGYEKYEKYIRSRAQNFKETMTKLYLPSESNFNVIIHGDFHCKNMMHKYQEGKIIETAMLDFQLSCVASPAIDLVYLLHLIIHEDESFKRRDEIISFYYDKFAATLTKLGYLGKCPSLLDLQVEILRCGPVEAAVVSQFLPFYIVDFSSIDMTQLMVPEKTLAVRRVIINTPRYKKILERCIPFFVQKGFIA